MDRQSFAGLWDFYCFPVHSELLLEADGHYHHAMLGAVQSHWGAWALEDREGQSVLQLELHGAQPVTFPGPFGGVPVAWPNSETWAVTAVAPNEIDFFHGRMVRRNFVALPKTPVGVAPVTLKAAPDASSGKETAAATSAAPASGASVPEAALPQAGSVPAGHDAPVMANWRKLSPDQMQMWQDSMKAIQGAYAGMQQNVGKAYTAMQQSNAATFADIYGKRQQAIHDAFAQRTGVITQFNNVVHNAVPDFISKVIQG
jgi:hypothetical protein